jgi:hypothetical protein
MKERSMAIEAPLSTYKRNSFLIGIVICAGLGFWCAYDGYFNKSFDAAKHEQWVVDANRIGPFVLLPIAAILGIWWHAIRGCKLVADEKELIVAGKARIAYDAIDRIDKTHFENRGFFTIFYKQPGGSDTKRKLSDRDYDNLPAILDHLIAKIT